MQRPFLLSGLIGIAVIIIGVVINLIGPGPSSKLPEGFITPIIAFEFATEDEQITHIFGKEGSLERDALLREMTNSTRLDFLFLILYGAFLLSFSIICASLTGNRLYYLAALLAIIAPVFDALENLQLFSIMEQLQRGNVHFELETLHFYTWVKWSALALTFLLLVPFFRSSGTFGRVLSICAVLPFAFGLIALINPGLSNELFALATVIMFVLMIVFSFNYKSILAPN